MQKAFFFFLSILLSQQILAQKSLPTIKAKSTVIDIKVGDDYFAKGGWKLEPAKNPDVFSIGSKWWYDTKKITFITDLDSISFNVQPAHMYDFVILLNKTSPCYIKITTSANPIFMNRNIAITVFSGLVLILIACYQKRNMVKSRMLLQFGYIAVLLFWLMTFISGYIHGNYNHLTNTISELGAIGTASEIFTSLALVITSLACIFFSIGFYQASKANKISTLSAVLSYSMPVSMIWASIFTLGNEFHSLAGPVPFLLILASLLSYWLWKKRETLLTARKICLLSFLIMMLILIKFVPTLGYEYEGLIQRFFYLGWSIWTIAVSYYFSKDL